MSTEYISTVGRLTPMKLRFPTAIVAASGLLAVSAGTIAAQGDAPQPPVEFSACIRPGPEVHRGTEERVVVPLSDGEMTITQGRGSTFHQSLTNVSDPRLEGDLYQAWDGDEYTLPGNELGPVIVVFTDRIENDEGAWQGSVVALGLPDDSGTWGTMVMTGEGAYEGLTALVSFDDSRGECVVKGYIIDGSIPEPPEPTIGQ
jgi:hypothetical protein